MTFTYQLTFDDFREALRGHAAVRRSRRAWLALVLGVGLLTTAVAATVGHAGGRPTTAPATAGGLRDLFVAVVPFLVMPLFLMTVLRLPVVRTAEPVVDVSRRLRRRVPLTAVNLTVQLATLVVILLPSGPSAATTTERVVGIVLPLLPVAAVVPLALYLTATVRRRTFAAQPNMTRSRTATVAAEEATFENELVRTTYRPPAIVQCIETPRLILLCPTFLSFEIIPKRAFATAEQMVEFRQLAQVWATIRTRGFPVAVKAGSNPRLI